MTGEERTMLWVSVAALRNSLTLADAALAELDQRRASFQAQRNDAEWKLQAIEALLLADPGPVQ